MMAPELVMVPLSHRANADARSLTLLILFRPILADVTGVRRHTALRWVA
ncbi:hypothetical protein [Streptomyces sp. NPDC047990]